MKFTATALLATLCAIPAAAFMPQSQSTAFRTSLSSTSMDQAVAQRIQELERKEALLSDQLRQTESRMMSRPSNRVGRGLGRSSQFGQRVGPNSAMIADLPPYDVTEIFENSERTTVQGGSLRTWSFSNRAIEFVQVMLKTEGRPLDADIQLWNGPDNTPNKIKVYVEDGAIRTFNALIGTPNGPNTIAIRNTGMLEFPLQAVVNPDRQTGQDAALAVEAMNMVETIQGGALRTYPFDSSVDSVAVLLKTDGRPLNARIELLQGPNNNKQVIELYTEDGLNRPFFAIIETPGSGNVVRIVNTAPIEFPLAATVQAYSLGNGAGAGAWGNDGLQIGNSW